MIDYNFVLRGISITITQYIIAYLLGALLAYIVNRNQKTLPRSPFLFLCFLNSLYSFIAMYLAICRARDGFGEKSASVLQLIEFLCCILYFVRLQTNNDGPIVRDPVPTPKWINGVTGFILAIIILFVNITINVQIFRDIPVHWVMF